MPKPSLVFDKSALQCLSPEESVWLDNFYRNNITPIFFVETLADLEKEVAAGRTPEQVVGALAQKTPDSESFANMIHSAVLWGELSGQHEVDFTMGRPMITGGQLLTLDGQMGMIFHPSQEEEALRRWENREFLDIERQIAKMWRRALTFLAPAEEAKIIGMLVGKRKAASFADAKNRADEIIDLWEQEFVLMLGLRLLNIPEDQGATAYGRWLSLGKPPIRTCFPYFCHMMSVDLTFYFATDANLVRNAKKPSNKVDLAYLYYLPFCCVFVSGDRLHRNLAPLFIRPFQTFVTADELKADLQRLNAHYSSLPDDVLETGMANFADVPPDDDSLLTVKLWDKYLPKWRTDRSYKPGDLPPQIEEALKALVTKFENNAEPADPDVEVLMSDLAVVSMKKKISLRKGRWRRYSPVMEERIIASEQGKQ